MKKIALHWQIITGMIFGLLVGIGAVAFGLGEFVIDWIKPFGTIFINLLKLIAVPLVIASLIKGIASLSDLSRLSKIGSKTVVIYLFTTIAAVVLGLVTANLINPGNSFSPEKREELKSIYSGKAKSSAESAVTVQNSGPLQFLVDMVPVNIFDSAKDNRNMLQVIFFSVLFGIAMISLPESQTLVVKQFFDGVNDIVIRIVELVMLGAPYGVFALLAGLLAEMAGSDAKGALEVILALGVYSFCVVLGLFIMVATVYPLLLKMFTPIKIKQFYNAIMPAQMLAFSSSSSAATLPVTMECCQKNLGVSKEISSFILPLGATVNMDGTSLYQAVATVFIAQVFGVDLSLGDQATIVLTATLASIGSAAVPGAGMVMLVIVLASVGLDPEGIALIFAVDRLLDMCRTVVNVTSDCAVACVIHHLEIKQK